MAGVRFSAMLFLLVILVLMSLLARNILAEDASGATTTSTYKSTTVERTTTYVEEVKTVIPPKKDKIVCAIFVKNRTTKVPDSRVAVLQDFAVGHVSDAGYSVISRENAANAVADFAASGPNRGDANKPGAGLDASLSNNTSALQLARNLNADCILSMAISSYGADTTHYQGHNIDVTSTQYRLKVSYELLDAYRGGSVTAGVITVSFVDRKQEGLNSVRENVLDDLLDAAANDAANMLRAAYNAGKVQTEVAAAKEQIKNGSFKINVSVANLAVPQIRKDDKGQYVIDSTWQPVQPPVTSIELDGVTVGSVPGPVQAVPGLHKLRLKSPLFEDWEGTVFVRDGLELSLSMQLNDRGVKQLAGTMEFFAKLRQQQAVSDAVVQEILGNAKKLEQSGFKVNVNATSLPSHQIMNKMEMH